MSPENVLVLANVISFIGNALFTSSALFKSKKRIIAMQSSCHFLNGVAELMSSAYSGLVQDGVMLFKNITLLFIDEEKKRLKLFTNVLCILLALVGGIVINILLSDNVWFGYLPVLGMFLYSVASTYVFVKEGLSKNKTEILLKSLLIVNGVCQCIYGIMVKLYPTTIFNAITIVLSIFSIIRICISIYKKKKNQDNLEDIIEE